MNCSYNEKSPKIRHKKAFIAWGAVSTLLQTLSGLEGGSLWRALTKPSCIVQRVSGGGEGWAWKVCWKMWGENGVLMKFWRVNIRVWLKLCWGGVKDWTILHKMMLLTHKPLFLFVNVTRRVSVIAIVYVLLCVWSCALVQCKPVGLFWRYHELEWYLIRSFKVLKLKILSRLLPLPPGHLWDFQVGY
jgi:hypothetical protein